MFASLQVSGSANKNVAHLLTRTLAYLRTRKLAPLQLSRAVRYVLRQFFAQSFATSKYPIL